MRIKDISETQPKIRDISKKAERVDPDEVAKALGAERISDVEKIIREKIEKAVELTETDRERFYLIRWILISAEMQGLIVGWDCRTMWDRFIFDIQVSFPMFPRLVVSVAMVEKGNVDSSIY